MESSWLRWSGAVLLLLLSARRANTQVELFNAELFLDRDDLNAGLYEGEVRGRKRFGDTQVPHGEGTIYYFTNDKFNRVNYTGDWLNGQREGNGTTSFQDGAVYRGGYTQGLEAGPGLLLYPNGNTLDAEFTQGKIEGHGVFRYANGDQREGFFTDNQLEGQVIFTMADGVQTIELWRDGEQVTGGEGASLPGPVLHTASPPGPVAMEGGQDRTTARPANRSSSRRRRPLRPPEISPSSPPAPSFRPSPPPPPAPSFSPAPTTAPEEGPRRGPRGRGGGAGDWSVGKGGGSSEIRRLGKEARSRAKAVLFNIFSNVNK